jgi:hypothetical protein
MPLTAAEQAVVDHLTAGPGPVTWIGPRSPGGWVASTRGGGGLGADPATIRFRKTRAFADCQLHEVEFTGRDGRQERWLVRTWQGPGGSWMADPIGGGSGAGPYRSKPWVNFAAQWGADRFAAGGEVIGQGAEAAHLVRLVFADGTRLEDELENGIVLFLASPGVPFPAAVEILNESGEVLSEYNEFTDLG